VTVIQFYLCIRTAAYEFPHAAGESAPGEKHAPAAHLAQKADVGADEGDAPIGYVASRAHQADIGGMAPGSMPVARELIQEGLVIPPIRLYRRGELVEEAMDLILRNVRTPDERRGDFNAQIAAQRLGERRIADLHAEYGDDGYKQTTEALLDYGERLTRAALRELPHGVWSFADSLDDDGHTPEPVPIRLRLTLDEDRAHFDFSGTAPQRAASITAQITETASGPTAM